MKDREELGKFVRQIWIDYCLETGDTKPSHLAPWSALSEQDKEADRRIGEAVWDEATAGGPDLAGLLAELATLRQAHADAWTLLGRCDMAFEMIIEATLISTAKKTAKQLRAEIAKASGG